MWKAEALWAAQVSPWRALVDVQDDELRRVLGEAHRKMKRRLDGTRGRSQVYRRAGRPLPERVPVGDLALLAVGTYKLSRLIAKDRITSFFRAPFTRYKGSSDRPSEVSEEPRGEGLRTRSLLGRLRKAAVRLGAAVTS